MKRIRLIVNGVSFYTSANAIARGVGDSAKINKVVLKGYTELLKANANNGSIGVGFSDLDGYQIQVDYV